MASNILTDDGSTRWLIVNEQTVHVALQGSFGGGTITVEREVNEVTGDLLNEGVAVTYTADFDEILSLSRGDVIRLTLSGATTPSIDWQVSGASIRR